MMHAARLRKQLPQKRRLNFIAQQTLPDLQELYLFPQVRNCAFCNDKIWTWSDEQ